MFSKKRKYIEEYHLSEPKWALDSGMEPQQLYKECQDIAKGMDGCAKTYIKSKIFGCIMSNAQLAVCTAEKFVSFINHNKIIEKFKTEWLEEVHQNEMRTVLDSNADYFECGAFSAMVDFGHASPDWNTIMECGIPGLLNRVRLEHKEKLKSGITKEQREFYETSEYAYECMLKLIDRYINLISTVHSDEDGADEMIKCLKSLRSGAPKNIYEAMQLSMLFYYILTNIEGVLIRTLGGLDKLFYKFYKNDIANGTFTKEEIKDLLKHYMFKLGAEKVIANMPFYICGMTSEGHDSTNELSYIILEAYDEMNIYDPKIHIRYNEYLPKDITLMALDMIRRGNSSILFINDVPTIEAYKKLGVPESEAYHYTVVGCYEPTIEGKEVACTCNGFINMPKAFEITLNEGYDALKSKEIGRSLKNFESYEDFYNTFIKNLECFVDNARMQVSEYEKHYMKICPAPLFSGTFEECVKTGTDVYAGGAKYNNSSVNLMGLATVADCLVIVKKAVFEENLITLEELNAVLKNNWKGHDKLRLRLMNNYPKFGNGIAEADDIAIRLAKETADMLNGKPNGRGGIFRCGMFSIDHIFPFGRKTGATPDGRYIGEPISKNISPSVCADTEGITGVINSLIKIDYTNIPNGTVLDVMYHPSAVQGSDGLDAMYSVLKVFNDYAGFAVHFNVFDADTLKKAQADPDKYKNLQIRVCGWNAYFVNLGKSSQDLFIKQAEGIN